MSELGTRRERLSIGIPVWMTAVTMAYVGVPWLVAGPLGVVGLVLIAGALTPTAQGASLMSAAVAGPLVGAHLLIALPAEPMTLPGVTPETIMLPRPQPSDEVIESRTGPYAVCADWGAVEAVALDCPSCVKPEVRTQRMVDLSGLPDARRCERVFAHTVAHWRSRTGRCAEVAQAHPVLQRVLEAGLAKCPADSDRDQM
jgi:hypothetical protein